MLVESILIYHLLRPIKTLLADASAITLTKLCRPNNSKRIIVRMFLVTLILYCTNKLKGMKNRMKNSWSLLLRITDTSNRN